MKMRRLVSMFLAAAMLLLLAACGGNNDNSNSSSNSSSSSSSNSSSGGQGGDAAVDTVKVIDFVNMSGSGSVGGDATKKAIDLLAEMINENGGVQSLGGAKIEVIYGDIQSDQNQVKTVIERVLTENPDAVACLGTGGSAYTVTALPIYEKYGIACVTMNVAESIVTSGYTTPIMASACADQTGPLQVNFLQYMRENYGYDTSKCAILYTDNDYGQSNATGSQSLIESTEGLELTYSSPFPADISDATSIITAIKASGAEVLFLTCDIATGTVIMDAMNALDYHPVIIGGGGAMVQNSFAEALGDACLGLLSSSISASNVKNVTDDEFFSEFVRRYEELYGPGNEYTCAETSGLYIIYQAVEKSGSTDRSVILETIKSEEFKTMYPQANAGLSSWDENGKSENGLMLMVQWQKGDDGAYHMNCVYPQECVGDGAAFLDLRNQ